MPADLDHVTIVASDFAPSLKFYDAALAALGMTRAVEFGDEEEAEAAVEAAGWGHEDGPVVLWLVAGTTPTTGVHLSLRAGSRSDVETFFEAAVAAGGRTHHAPRRWPIFRRGDFSAVVLDPAGNTVEAVAGE